MPLLAQKSLSQLKSQLEISQQKRLKTHNKIKQLINIKYGQIMDLQDKKGLIQKLMSYVDLRIRFQSKKTLQMLVDGCGEIRQVVRQIKDRNARNQQLINAYQNKLSSKESKHKLTQNYQEYLRLQGKNNQNINPQQNSSQNCQMNKPQDPQTNERQKKSKTMQMIKLKHIKSQQRSQAHSISRKIIKSQHNICMILKRQPSKQQKNISNLRKKQAPLLSQPCILYSQPCIIRSQLNPTLPQLPLSFHSKFHPLPIKSTKRIKYLKTQPSINLQGLSIRQEYIMSNVEIDGDDVKQQWKQHYQSIVASKKLDSKYVVRKKFIQQMRRQIKYQANDKSISLDLINKINRNNSINHNSTSNNHNTNINHNININNHNSNINNHHNSTNNIHNSNINNHNIINKNHNSVHIKPIKLIPLKEQKPKYLSQREITQGQKYYQLKKDLTYMNKKSNFKIKKLLQISDPM